MLNIEDLKGNESLKGISDEQLEIIAQLSKADEDKVIANKTREIWDSVDADIKAVTGLEKEPTTKSYNFLKNVLSELNTGKGDPEKLKGYEAKIADLEKQLKSGNGDKALQNKVSELESELQKKTSRLQELDGNLRKTVSEFEQKLAEKETAIMDSKWNAAINDYDRGMKYKAGIPQVAIDTMRGAALNHIKSIGTPEFQTTNDGKQVIHFKDEDGLLVYDKENPHLPLTADKAYLNYMKDVLADGGKAGGTGSRGGSAQSGTFLNLEAAKSRHDGLQMIIDHVSNVDGLLKGTQAHSDRVMELATENKEALDKL